MNILIILIIMRKRDKIGYAIKLHMEVLERVHPSNSDITRIIRRFREII